MPSSLATYRAAGLREYVGPVLNNMGLAYTQLERFEEAQEAYDEALAHCDATGDSTNRLLALINSPTCGWRAETSTAPRRSATPCSARRRRRPINGRSARRTSSSASSRGREGNLEAAETHLTRTRTTTRRGEKISCSPRRRRGAGRALGVDGQKPRDAAIAVAVAPVLHASCGAQRNLADLKRRVGRLETRFYDVVTRWAHTIESKDAYTLGHCERVADYSCALARDIGFDEMTMFWFRIGALLHDVGKIVVPSEILNKPGPLERRRARG